MTNNPREFINERSAIRAAAQDAPWGSHAFGFVTGDGPESIAIFAGEEFDWDEVERGNYVATTPVADYKEDRDASAIVDAHNNLPTVLKMLGAVLDLCDQADENFAPVVGVADIRQALGEVLARDDTADA